MTNIKNNIMYVIYVYTCYYFTMTTEKRTQIIATSIFKEQQHHQQ